MHSYETTILEFLKARGRATLDEIESSLGLGRDAVLWAIEGLLKENLVGLERRASISVSISKEGKGYASGFPEEKLAAEAKRSGGRLKLAEIKDQIGLGWAKKNGWISIGNGYAVLTKAGSEVAEGKTEYQPRALLGRLGSSKTGEIESLVKSQKPAMDTLVKRGLVELKSREEIGSVYITPEGQKRKTAVSSDKGIGMLTKEAINSGSWKKTGFRKYDINAPVDRQYPARMHPVREFINTVRRRWLEMGFVEVSGPIVESAFWNFDALFSPQDHPTREMQDTFFLSNPKQLSIDDVGALEQVRRMHTDGWEERWSEEVAKSALLRTHTTSVSARYMRKLAKSAQENYPLRLFSVGPVFRNESIDYKHLAELHQYDGLIIGDNLTLAHLIDTLKRFYAKLGFDNVKLRPSYFPFTEPSLEAFYYDEEHGDHIELTGGGIIRSEITKAMGIDRTVLAWGGGIERLMINKRIFGLDSIPALYKNNIGWLRERPDIKV